MANVKFPITAPTYTTSERDALSSLLAGMVIYNLTTNKLQVYNSAAWIDLH